MKVCILNGSPHSHGSTMKLVEKYVEGAEAAGQAAFGNLDSVLEQIGQNMCDYTGMTWLGIITQGNTGNAGD